jgi:hypothetical protein
MIEMMTVHVQRQDGAHMVGKGGLLQEDSTKRLMMGAICSCSTMAAI